MTKPIRLNPEFMSEVERYAALEHRSLPKQVEYWASLGKIVARHLRPEDSLALMQGLVTIRIEHTEPQGVDVDDVLARLEADSHSGRLPNLVTGSAFRYGIDPTDPGRLVRVDAAGSVVVDASQGTP